MAVGANTGFKNILNTKNLFTAAGYGAKTRQLCAIRAAATEQQVNTGTIDYTGGYYQTYRTHSVNGFIIPEWFTGDWDNNTVTQQIGQSSQQAAYVSTTGAQQAILRRRFVMDFPLTKGMRVGNFCLYSLATESNDQGTAFIGTNTNQAGTITVTANFGVINEAGTKTQAATGTYTVTMTATAFREVLFLEGNGLVTCEDNDNVYLEVVIDTNQTARTAGINSTGAGFQYGFANHLTTSYNVTCLEFDIL